MEKWTDYTYTSIQRITYLPHLPKDISLSGEMGLLSNNFWRKKYMQSPYLNSWCYKDTQNNFQALYMSLILVNKNGLITLSPIFLTEQMLLTNVGYL